MWWRVVAGAMVVGLIAVGATLLAVAGGDPLRAQLGGGIFVGGLVSGAFVLVGRMLEWSATERNELDRLRRQLESSESFPAMDLKGKDLSGLYLPYRVFFDAELENANLTGTSLLFSDLRFIKAEGANFSGADLSGADLSGANLRKADFQSADLTDSDLSRADLTDAKLTGATLTRVKHPGAKWPEGFDPRQHIDGEQTDLSDLGLLQYLEYRKCKELGG